MAKFRSKEQVEAIQINNNAEEVQAFIGDKGTAIDDVHTTLVTLETPLGLVSVTNGAYILKRVNGFYDIKKDIFEALYEKVD